MSTQQLCIFPGLIQADLGRGQMSL